ncbi:hypothetical protein [Nocardioides jensenii]|uniref:hypothetical protein n=1 Tax=Nocardioides jensenii TaxID=1843 RepID=UPI000830AE44|nr:hypothetical protein [Nocardioides jensenii]
MRYRTEKAAGILAVVREDGVTLARLNKVLGAERATGLVEGVPWTFDKHPDGIRTATSSLRPGVHFARSAGPFRAHWELVCGPTRYEIKRQSPVARRYDVVRDGVVIGVSGGSMWWGIRPDLDVADDVPAADAVFLLWVALIMRTRSRREPMPRT